MIIFQTSSSAKSYVPSIFHVIYNVFYLYNIKISYIYNIMYREEMDNHLESMQTDLENLREILRGEGYSIDANTLLGVNIILKYLKILKFKKRKKFFLIIARTINNKSFFFLSRRVCKYIIKVYIL